MTLPGGHARGIMLAAGGMVLISPDGLLYRLVDLNDLQVLFWRGLFSAAALCLWVQFSRPGGLPGAVRAGGLALLACVLLLSVETVFFVMSIMRTTVANTVVIFSTTPLFAALMAMFFLRQRVGPGTWLAIACAMTGVAIIFSGSLGGGSLTGDLLAVASAVTLAGNLTIIRARPETSMPAALGLSAVVIACVMGATVDIGLPSAKDLAVTFAMGVVIQGLAFSMLLAAARYLPPAETALFVLLESVLGPLWAWLGVGEVPATVAFVGGALIITALGARSGAMLARQPGAATGG